MPHKRKKGGKKSKRSGEGRKQKVKDEILLSVHARTLKAVIWHQEQKLVQCSTCKQRFGQFGLFSARQWPKNGLTRFERHFLAKCPGVNGLRKTKKQSIRPITRICKTLYKLREQSREKERKPLKDVMVALKRFTK